MGSFFTGTDLGALAFLVDVETALPLVDGALADLRLLVRAADFISRADFIDFFDEGAAEVTFAFFFDEAALLMIFTVISGASFPSFSVFCVLTFSAFLPNLRGSNSSMLSADRRS